MDAFSQIVEKASADGVIPGGVVAATNIDGSLNYVKAFGKKNLVDGTPCEADTIMALFSATKLITTIAALQLVEKGAIGLDDEVSGILPELGVLEVLHEMKDGEAVLKKRTEPMTLRRLLTHSAGVAYSFMVPKLGQYFQSKGLPPFSPPTTVVKSYASPLAFEPGKSWTYSTGLDWAGVLISRISGLDLEIYFHKHIFTPLGISDLTFWPTLKPSLAARMASLSMRDPDGTGKAIPNKGPNMNAGVQEEFGGQGLFASMPAYLEILKSILVDDERLLNKSTTATMFEPQLTSESQQALQALYDSQPAGGPCAIGKFPPGVPYNWGFGGLLTCADVHEGEVDYRKKGCLSWSGMPNLYWFVDRKAGVCGIFGLQIVPAGDKPIKDLHVAFEKAVYKANL